jgi:hypothetical protein
MKPVLSVLWSMNKMKKLKDLAATMPTTPAALIYG